MHQKRAVILRQLFRAKIGLQYWTPVRHVNNEGPNERYTKLLKQTLSAYLSPDRELEREKNDFLETVSTERAAAANH